MSGPPFQRFFQITLAVEDGNHLQRFETMLAELYPTSIRGSGQGFVYNTGRAASALALDSAFFLIGAAMIFTLPKTRGTELA